MALLSCQNLIIGFGGRFLLEDASLQVENGERVGLVGRNGEGKSTLLKILDGSLPHDAGRVVKESGTRVALLTQQVPTDVQGNVAQVIGAGIDSGASAWDADHAVQRLCSLLQLEGGHTFAALSGGQKRRALLGRALAGDPDLLLLDEPTNHLDIPSQEILQTVLAEYQGTILLVSHDRYLIDALSTHIWEIEARGTMMIVFEGDYSAYRAFREGQKERDKALAAQQGAGPARKLCSEEADSDRPKEPSAWELRQRERRQLEIEREIEVLETRLAALESQLAEPPSDPAEVERLGKAYVVIQGELNNLMGEWEELAP